MRSQASLGTHISPGACATSGPSALCRQPVNTCLHAGCCLLPTQHEIEVTVVLVVVWYAAYTAALIMPELRANSKMPPASITGPACSSAPHRAQSVAQRRAQDPCPPSERI